MPDSDGPGPIGYLSLVLAWAVPGLGHFLLGEKKHGIIFALTIHALFAGGLLLGGIRAINPPDQPIWTYTQFLTGWPMVICNRIERTMDPKLQAAYAAESEYMSNRPSINDESPEDIAKRQAYAKAYIADHPLFIYHPKVQDIGAVYCGIAGMLNLLVMFDVLLRITGSVREDPTVVRKRQDAEAAVVSAPSSPSPAPSPTTVPSPDATPLEAPR
jgi:hypothetical protein